MPVVANWADPDETIMQYDITGDWTWDEYYPVYEKVLAQVKQKDYTVDIITNLTKAKGSPPNALTHMRYFDERRPDNMGINVTVTENLFVVTMIRVATNIFAKLGRNFRIATTVEEAREIIAKDVQVRNAISSASQGE